MLRSTTQRWNRLPIFPHRNEVSRSGLSHLSKELRNFRFGFLKLCNKAVCIDRLRSSVPAKTRSQKYAKLCRTETCSLKAHFAPGARQFFLATCL